MNKRLIRALAASSLLLGLAGALAPASGVAQEATPAMMQEMAPHPAHIHSGVCPDVGDVVFPLTDVTAMDMMGTPIAGMDDQATPMAGDDADMDDDTDMDEDMAEMDQVVAMSSTVVEASLADILGAEHAINVHESAENIGNYIACGDITGEPEGDAIEITLEERNDSGVEGEAYLTDNGDGTTTVDVMLMRVSHNEMAESEATPTG